MSKGKVIPIVNALFFGNSNFLVQMFSVEVIKWHRRVPMFLIRELQHTLRKRVIINSLWYVCTSVHMVNWQIFTFGIRVNNLQDRVIQMYCYWKNKYIVWKTSRQLFLRVRVVKYNFFRVFVSVALILRMRTLIPSLGCLFCCFLYSLVLCLFLIFIYY